MSDSTRPKAPPSRRQQRKAQTRRALQHAALELFAKQGYDDTTTDEISEAAGVSPRTFFRYFSTKESVLFVGEYGWIKSLNKHFLLQPDSLSDFDALRQTLIEFAPRLTPGRRSFKLYERAIDSSPTLRGRVLDNIQHDTTTIAAAIAERRGQAEADEGCALLATVVLAAYRRALTRWLAGPAKLDLGEVIADEFELLVDQLPTATRASAPAAAEARG